MACKFSKWFSDNIKAFQLFVQKKAENLFPFGYYGDLFFQFFIWLLIEGSCEIVDGYSFEKLD